MGKGKGRAVLPFGTWKLTSAIATMPPPASVSSASPSSEIQNTLQSQRYPPEKFQRCHVELWFWSFRVLWIIAVWNKTKVSSVRGGHFCFYVIVIERVIDHRHVIREVNKVIRHATLLANFDAVILGTHSYTVAAPVGLYSICCTARDGTLVMYYFPYYSDL